MFKLKCSQLILTVVLVCSHHQRVAHSSEKFEIIDNESIGETIDLLDNRIFSLKVNSADGSSVGGGGITNPTSDRVTNSINNIIMNSGDNDSNFLKLNKIENSINKSKIDMLSVIFKRSITKIKSKYKKNDIVFLIDSSSSVGKLNFLSEIKFVQKLLSDLNVSYNSTRVAVITFGSHGKVIRHIDQISSPSPDNDKCKLLNIEIPRIQFNGGGTYTYGALEKAKETFDSVNRENNKKIVFLITDGFSNGRDPVPMAKILKSSKVAIFTIGIQNGNYRELYNIASTPGEEYTFLLDSFSQFESLARKALHSDYRIGLNLRVVNQSRCDLLCDDVVAENSIMRDINASYCCDKNAECVCGTTSGHYSCMCQSGYYGSGFKDTCELCPNGTYWQSWNLCRPCPDINHITIKTPAISIDDCVCKNGFKTGDPNRCQVITCPKLDPPANGYFVKHPTGCGNVLNAACGARCKSGFQLSGSSIRLCQENGTWSGVEPKCVLKTCPSIPISYYGTAKCKNMDLDMIYDYTFKNTTFVDDYENDTMRITEPLPIDTECKFECGPGFYLVGSPTRNCLPLSKWDGLPTMCKQILCAPLPVIPFGEYDPTDCDHQKQAHATNCTINCLPGFEARGPINKYCGGKRSGIWTHKLKTPKCVDVTAPVMKCPSNYEIPLEPTDNYALVFGLTPPDVKDNSDLDVMYWTKPAIKNDGIKLSMGPHNFTYIAVDSFKNKVRCNFTVIVVDKSPPVMEYCIDPPPFAISLSPNADKNDSFIQWDDPIIYDNSNGHIQVTQSLQYGFLGIGKHQANYTAIDEYGNLNSCILNITVIELRCNKLDSPQNGQTICAQNKTHMWCEVNCNFGFGIHLQSDNDHLERLSLMCDHEMPRWGYDYIPDCAAITLPNSVQEIFSLSLDSDTVVCGETNVLDAIQDTLKAQVHEVMCTGQMDCEVVSDVAFCNLEEDSPLDSELNERQKTFYNIVKRDLRIQGAKPKVKSHMKVNIYTKVSKELGYWNSSISRSENIKVLKDELTNIERNEKLQEQLANLNIEIKSVKHDLKIKCKEGSVFKRQYCLQCPSGTFHNKTMNFCQPCPMASYNQLPGQLQCTKCPLHFSTKRMHSKTIESCREQCRPGTTARLKVPKNSRPNQKPHKSLMPFCKKCNPGEYQQFFDQTHCVRCPEGYTSPRGARLLSECRPKIIKLCLENPSICGQNGRCIQENSQSDLYSCLCKDGYIGAHCEKQMNACLSSPCVNDGLCESFGSEFMCLCPKGFNGQFCENNLDPCNDYPCVNNGNCIEINGKPRCDCEPGYIGEYCEIQINHCQSSPCENGDCVSTAVGFQCKCVPGFIGRRCHLRPCDYLPCSEMASCIDIDDYPTSKNSFICVCSKGLKGFYCNVIDNPCDRNPCRNNGLCIPKILRQSNDDPNVRNYSDDEIDEEEYTKYKCDCPPFFYGNFCQIFISPDYILSFEKSSVNDYVQMSGPRQNLREISFCVWLQTSDSFNYGVILSYASQKSDNMFTFTDYNGFVLYVDGNHVITDITINDGLWHFICVTWASEKGFYEIYLDGKLHDTGYNLSPNSFIQANGSITIGQEQDDIGSSFSETEAFVGKIAYLDIWNHTLSAQTIQEYFMTCEPYLGNLVPWTDFKINIHGAVKVLPSPFCRSCPTNLLIDNGQVDIFDNKALYECNDGYMIKGLPIRRCLRTSQWELPVPHCQPITCGTVRSPMNGYAKRIRTVKGDQVIYSCDDGYNLIGESIRNCLGSGSWSENTPQCVSKVYCGKLNVKNGEIIYATDSGPLNPIQLNYPVGTMAEIHCLNDTLMSGENLLFCMESGSWDVNSPLCYKEQPSTTTTTTTTTSTTTTTTTDSPPDENLIFWTLILAKVDAMTYPIDIDFLQNLREYYFYGCVSDNSPKLSIFCYNKSANSKNLTDLTDFNTPNTDEFFNIDEKWIEFLISHINLILVNETSARLNITSENLLDLLIYNRNTSENYTEPIEDTFRLYFCFYLDSLILDHKFTSHDIADYNNLEKIQLLIKYLIFPFWSEYTIKKNSTLLSDIYNVAEENTTPMVTTTTTELVINCKLSELNLDLKLFTAGYSSDGGTTIKTRYEPTMVEQIFNVNDLIVLGCIQNYIFTGNSKIICTGDGSWSTANASCTEVMCATPNKPASMVIENAEKKYRIGSRVSLKCTKGYSIHGNPQIECTATGKWSRIFARCLKISCNKPKLPANTSIKTGRSYLYQDKLIVLCPNEKEMEIECADDGKWIPHNICK